jgi:RNA polymerase sigma-70 factor, ECF subfamily
MILVRLSLGENHGSGVSDLEGLTDKTLVAQACEGSRQAYAELIRRHYKAVFWACLGMVGRTCDAEDVAQETFLKALMEIRRLRDAAQFGPWIIRIAKNNSINLLRRKQRMDRSTDKLMDPPACGREATHSVDLERALARLPESLRGPLVMHYLEHKAVETIARDMQMSASNVYQRLRTALQEIHALLIKQGDAL